MKFDRLAKFMRSLIDPITVSFTFLYRVISPFLPSPPDILEIRFPPPIEIPSRLSLETNLSSSLLLDLKDLCIRRVHRRIAYPKFK